MVSVMIILGISLNIIAIILIMKNRSDEEIRYNNSVKIYEEITEYSDTINNIILDLEKLIENAPLNNQKEGLFDIDFPDKKNKDKNKDYDINFKNVNDKVIELYKMGNSIDEIAKKLNKGKREVEIIVKLNKLNKK